MKLNKFLLGAVAACLLSACSNEEVTPAGGDTSFEGDGYLAVSIQLPTTTMTRAANDNFDDGTQNEYKVDNGALLLFTGADESNAVFHSAYNLGDLLPAYDEDNDQITTSFLKALKVKSVKLNAGENLYALVMLNYDGVVTNIAADATSITVAGTTLSENSTYSSLLNAQTNQAFRTSTNTHFFMTNAPLSTVPGGAAASVAPTKNDLFTLVALTGGLKNTEEEAKASPAGSIFVERAVAKATLSAPSTATINGNQVDIVVKWALQNMEEQSYIVRNLGSLDQDYLSYKSTLRNNYRFVGSVVIGENPPVQEAVPYYRTYWCIDPNYNKDKTYDAADITAFTSTADPLYCHENTFDVEHQNHKNTTRAVLEVTFAGGTFYSVNGQNQMLTMAEAEQDPRDLILNSTETRDAFYNALNNGQSFADYKNHVTITFTRNETTGIREVTDIVLDIDGYEIGDGKTFAQMPAYESGVKERLIRTANTYYEIAEFKDGKSYYELRFKHFAGDNSNDQNDLAPWVNNTPATPSTSEAYPSFDGAQYLGRYGMVRNNWYDVTVSRIQHVGSPVIPTGDLEKPDDSNEEDLWIAFQINVLSWAKRTQTHEF